MHALESTIENTHFPSADDITLDSLGYLLGNSDGTKKEIPWVEILPASAAMEAELKETRLHIKELKEQLSISQDRNCRLLLLVGYLQGLLASKDKELEAFLNLRERQVGELEPSIERLKTRSETAAEISRGREELAKAPKQWLENTDTLSLTLYTLALLSFAAILYFLLGGV